MAVMHDLSSSSGLAVPVGFAKLHIARWTVGTIFKFCHLLIIQRGHWHVFGQYVINSDMLKIEICEEGIHDIPIAADPRLFVISLYSGKDETVRQQKPLGTCLSINFVVFPASISSFSRKLSKSAKMANGTFI